MSQKPKGSRWKLVLTILSTIALVVLIVALHHQILGTVKDLKNINIWALALIIPLELLNYDAQARMYELSLRVLGANLTYWLLYKVSLELNFVSTILPSGGISSFSYMNIRLKAKGVSAAQATLVQIIKYMLVFGSFLVLLLIGLFMLAIVGRASNIMILISAALVTLMFVLAFIVIFVIGSKKRVESFFTSVTKIINRLIKLVRPKLEEPINIEGARNVFRELHESYMKFSKDRGALKKPLLYAIIANLTEVAALYVVYIAFGHWVNPGAVIMAYAVANFAGFVSVLPGGVGVYETLMTVVLAAGGVSPSLSIPVTIMYRVVNTLIQIAPGYFFYQKALRVGHQENG